MGTLGQTIKKARIDKRMKQKELVERTRLSQKYISEVELDKVDPRFSTVQRIAAVLGLSLDAIAPRQPAARLPPPGQYSDTTTGDGGTQEGAGGHGG